MAAEGAWLQGCALSAAEGIGKRSRPCKMSQWISCLHLRSVSQASRFEAKKCGIILCTNMAVCQNLVPLVNIKIAGKWMFIPLKIVFIGIDPYPYDLMCNKGLWAVPTRCCQWSKHCLLLCLQPVSSAAEMSAVKEPCKLRLKAHSSINTWSLTNVLFSQSIQISWYVTCQLWSTLLRWGTLELIPMLTWCLHGTFQ